MKDKIKLYWPLIIPVLIALTALVFWASDQSTDQKYIGIVEADYVDVASEIPGRLSQKLFVLGDVVKKGQIIGKMSPKEVNAITDQSQAAVDAAKSQLALIKKGARKEEIHAAKSIYLLAKDQYTLAQKTYNRMKALHQDLVISDEEFDIALFKYKASKKEMAAAKDKYELLKNGPREEAIQTAEALVQQAEDAHLLSKTLGSNIEIVAPCDGMISTDAIEEGEIIMIGYPLATIQKAKSMHIVLQVKQNEIAYFEKDKIISGRIPGLKASDIQFKVTHLAVLMDYADWTPSNQKGSIDLKTFEIHLEPINKIDGLIAGMSVQLFPNTNN